MAEIAAYLARKERGRGREREGEGKRERDIYVYIHTYERDIYEREIGKERNRERRK